MKGIITGDIVGSSRIKGAERESLLKAITEIAADLSKEIPFGIEVFRGDSFQIQTVEPAESVRIAVLFRAALKAATPEQKRNTWDARISVGVGDVDYEGDRLAVSDGEAFRLSGRGLDEIGKRRLIVDTCWPDINDELSVSTAFADDIITEWSRVQADLSFLKLYLGKTQKEVVELTGRTQQSVSKILASSREVLISRYLKRCATIIGRKVEERMKERETV